ncbi:GRIP and coiled-coil domain-containing protein 1 isoform X1 [Nilaparvata lugens]|uniref:GRIP and coiled-coil domain-containing protein 1 isoform X1 n=1 Tax=Nilaparvata lugens TaxID=108931 RepID=UPI00193D0E25|nr:GRIP and coiled-coil domain-containing protein 1 isoform X1 [Nilaparvata lugens]XP_039289206.1 GRIP and coiled-coil domain-containing protein 1 isoform X1 [Nilaparvata lugens]
MEKQKSTSKKELLEIIKKQEEDLSKYKKRFQDVVATLKRTLKEKDALESSLMVMRNNSSSDTTSVNLDCSIDDNSSTSSKVEDVHSEDGSSASANESVDHLKGQLATLMQSIATLSSEKSRMEATFQADRKALRVEKEEQEKTLKDLHRKLEEQAQSHSTEVENYKTKLMLERRQREKEHQDHGMMIRELQKLVEEERSKKENALKNYTDCKRELIAAQSVAEVREKELNSQLENFKRRLMKEQDSSAPLLSSLQQEISAMRDQHSVALQKEQERASHAENQTKKLVAMHEERVANLEARLAELSNTVGNYDRVKEEDQCAIRKLKDRLAQLELDHNDETELEKDGETSLDVETLVSKLKHIKSLVDKFNEESENPVDVQAVLFGDKELMNLNKYASSDHSLCLEEYQALKNEFEEYKKMVKKNPVPFSPSKEDTGKVEKLERKLSIVSEKARDLQDQQVYTIKHYEEQIRDIHKAFAKEKEKLQETIASKEQAHRVRLADLESQMLKQRERAFGLVRDKDEEINSLKATFQTLLPSTVSSKISDKDQPNDTTAVTRKTSTSSDVSLDVTAESRPMLHYVQELARLQIDVARLRRQKHALETSQRDLQLKAAEEKEAFLAQTAILMASVARLERCQTREGANLEYLKNVVLSYLLNTDENRRSHMLNAIATVLQFSDQEKISVIQAMNQKMKVLS